MNRIAGILGLAKRANALVGGTTLTLDAVRKGKALLVLAANDISPGTEKQLRDKTSYRNVPLEVLPFGADELGHCIGKTKTAAVALLNPGFVASYRKAAGKTQTAEEPAVPPTPDTSETEGHPKRVR